MDIKIDNILKATGKYRSWLTNPKRPRFEGDTKKCLSETMNDLGEIVVQHVAREMVNRKADKLDLGKASEILGFTKEHNDVIKNMLKEKAEGRGKPRKSLSSMGSSSSGSLGSN